MTPTLRHAESDAEIRACFPVMQALRPHLASATGDMTRILHLVCSPRGAGACSRQFSDRVVARLRQHHPQATVITRDLAADPPPGVDAAFAAAILAPPASDHPALRASEALIRELEASDALVIATPMHNFSIPATLKAWIDQVVRIHRTFASVPAGVSAPASVSAPAGKVGRLADRPVFVVVASGGWFTRASPIGTPPQPDFLRPYLRTILGVIGLRTVHFLALEGVTRGPEALARAVATAETTLDALLPPVDTRPARPVTLPPPALTLPIGKGKQP